MHIINVRGIVVGLIAAGATLAFMSIAGGLEWGVGGRFAAAQFGLLVVMVDLRGRFERTQLETERKPAPSLPVALLHPIQGGTLFWVLPMWLVASCSLLVGLARVLGLWGE